MGTPDFAVASLRALVESGHNIVGVVTAPDKPAGRGLKMQRSAVGEYACAHGLKLLQSARLKDPAFLEELRALDADLGVVIAFRMLPQEVWALPRLGTFNLHASLLPEYRGAAPINRAIIDGATRTGVTTFMLNAGMDTGSIIAQREVAIEPTDTAGILHDRLMEIGAGLVVTTVSQIAAGEVKPVEQPSDDESLRTAPKIFKDDCRIDWHKHPDAVYNFVRGLSPYPTAWSVLRNTNGEEMTVKIFAATPEFGAHENTPGAIFSDGRTFLSVTCRGGYISITELQPAGKRRMSVAEFLRGFKGIADSVFV